MESDPEKWIRRAVIVAKAATVLIGGAYVLIFGLAGMGIAPPYGIY